MISLLYVDDEPGLLDIAKVFLEQSPDLRVDIFLSAKEALASPQFASYDAIISDYQMPGMDGIAFLKTVRKEYGTIPFILFTGRGREEIVIEAINNGADFYLQKGGDVRSQFAELAHKIRQAVGRRQAEFSLIESEKRQSEIIDFLPDATFAIDRDGVVIAWNRAIEEMTGVPAAAMLGRGDYEYALPFYGTRRPLLIDMVFKTDEEISAYYSIISREGSAITAETDHAHPKGMIMPVLLKASPLYNRQGEPVGAIESIRNITEMKKIHDELQAAYEQISASEEELREQFDILAQSETNIRENAARLTYMLGFYERAGSEEKDLLDYAVEGAGIVTGSPLGYLALLNDDESELSMYAWSQSAMKECSIRNKPIVYRTSSTGLWGEAVRQRRAVVTNDYTAPNPWKKGYPAGHPPIIRHMNVPVIDDGRVVMVAGVANKAHEYTDNDVRQLTLLVQGLWQVLCQQRTKKALRDSEVRFRSIFEKSHDALMLNEGDHLVDCNRHALELFGYDSVDEMVRMHPADASPACQPDGQDSRTAAGSHLRTAFATGEDRFEWVHKRKDGSTFPAEVTLSTFEIGGKTYLQTSIRDISERKEAEAALRERDENYRSVVEFSPLGMHFYELLPDGDLIFTGANPAADTILATDHSLLCGKRIEEVFPGLAGTDIPDQYRKVASEGGVFHNDQVIYDGETIRGAFSVQAFRIRPGIMVATFTDITERKRTEAALREKTEELDRFFTTSLDLFCIAGTDGSFRRLNPEWERALGYPPADLEGHRILDFVHPDDLPATLDAISRLKEQEEILNFTNRYRHRDGTYRWIEWRSKPVGDLIYAAARDITERKKVDDDLRAAYEQISASEEELREQYDVLAQSEHKLEKSERRLTLAMEAANEGLWDWNLKTNSAYFSPQYYRMLGYEPGDFSGSYEAWRSLVHPDDIEHAESTIRASIRHRKLFEIEFRLRTKDGGWKWILGRGSVIESDTEGNPVRMVGTHVDISRVKDAEEAAREKTEELDRFFTTSLDLFCIAGTDGSFRRLNPEWERALGYPPADLEGHRFLDFVHPDDLPATLDAISRLKEQEEILNFTNRYRHRDGTYRWIEWRSKPVGDLIYAAARDITSRIETDRALREINDRYQLLFDAMHDCVAVYDAVDDGADFVFLEFNHAAEKAEKVSRDQVIGQRVTAAFPGVAEFGLLEVLQRVWRTGTPEQFPLALYKDDRIAGWRDNYIYKLPNGEIVASYHDETRRKQAEDALCASEEKYRSILENIQDVYYRSDRHGNLVMASPSILPLLGYDTLDDLIGKNIARDIWEFPERRADFLARLKKDGSVKNYDAVLKRRDGSTVTVCSSSHYYYDEDGTIAGVEGIFHDVTAVREAEQHLQLLAGLLDTSPASVTVHDYDGKFLYANPRTFDLHGYTKDEFMALNLHQLDVPASEKHIAERMEMLRSRGEASFDVEHFKKDGSRIPLHVALRRIRWNDADAIMSVATEICGNSLSDIPSCNGTILCTSIVDNSFDIIYMLRPDGTITFISPSWTKTLGHTPAEVIGRSFQQFVVEEDIPSCMAFLERTLRSCQVQPGHEFRVYHKDGSVHWYRTSLKPVCSPEGSVTTLVGNAVDFTTYRAAGEALRESEARYRTVIENIQDAFLRADPSGNLVMASPSAARMLGFPAAGAMLGLPVSRFFADPSDFGALKAKLDAGGSITDCEVRFVKSDGTPFWGSLNARPIHDETTKITGTDLVIHDISDHRTMEHAIREANKKLSLLNSITRHDVANQLVAHQGFVQIASMMKTDPVIHDYLKKIQGVADTITRQIEFTRTYQELGIGVPLWFSIEDIVTRAQSRVPVKFSKTCRTIEVFADPMLERVFLNLFDNAARHGGNVSLITVRCEREPDGILIIVEDDGTGIPITEKENIFGRGYGKHTGLGLFLAKEILAITGIRIRETGIPGSGARFELVVPQTSCRYAR